MVVALALFATSCSAQIDPDAGIVIDWAGLDKVVANYSTAPPEAWRRRVPPEWVDETIAGRPIVLAAAAAV